MRESGTSTSTRARRATRSVVSASQTAARASASAAGGASRVVHRLTGASGAGRTGLANLIELTAASSIGDAFVAVALAGSLFFSVSVDQARPKVALALLITLAPFAVLAPFIGPMLDKVQQGRRFILAGTLLARGLLCWSMAVAVQHNDPADLLPAAFGVLVLQQAFGVTRSAIAPRLLPAEITLVTANSRSALASLIATTLGGGTAAGIDLIAGGGQAGAAWVLRIGTVAYLAAMTLCLRLPDGVDSPQVAPGGTAGLTPASPGAGPAAGTGGLAGTTNRHAPGPNGARGPQGTVPLPQRGRRRWRFPSLGPIVGEAMGANAAQRAFSGFMIFFLIFLLRTVHFGKVPDKLALAEMVGAATLGGFLGTAIGAGLKSRAPQVIVFGMLGLTTVVTATCAVLFGLWAALAVALMAGVGQALVKLALDSIVQREIGEEVRSSTFAASQTLHQLSWVAGALAGVLMSLTNSGVAGLSFAASGLAVALTVLMLRRRRRILDSRQRLVQPQAS
jgi:MFS family permease